MKIFGLIDTTTNKCVYSGNTAEVFERFKEMNYPPEIKLVNENGKTLVEENREYSYTVDLVQSLSECFCKVCPKCGRLLPKEMFHKKAASKDGLQDSCKDCRQAYNKARLRCIKSEKEKDADDLPNNLHKVYSNPDLAKFTPHELMAELKARGFKWEYMLEPQKRIMYDKI